MKRFYLAVNPHGGLKKGLGILDAVRPILEDGGAELTVLETEYAGHARDYANEVDYEGYDGFCAIGGDGTMHEVVNGMLKRQDGQILPIGLVTGGTGNSFMHDLDCLDPELAAKRILTGRLRPVDIAKVDANGEIYFGFNIVGWGMPTDINELAEKMRWLGGQRYNIASIIEVLKYKQRLAKLIIDGNTVVGDFGFILGCNTIHTGKGMKMAPLAQLNDGMIDLIIARKASRTKLLRLFPKLFSGAHVGDPIVEYRQVKEFSIIPQEDNILNIDGEMIGSTPIHVSMMPGAINVLV
ncbi:MAG: diacylglycerol kinase family protein [Candidatus Neomarinimicrobiota bacterium]|nr:diacylglycerol kinase family protein [Candidatus Neomarinimicrobiota bacterium]